MTYSDALCTIEIKQIKEDVKWRFNYCGRPLKENRACTSLKFIAYPHYSLYCGMVLIHVQKKCNILIYELTIIMLLLLCLLY